MARLRGMIGAFVAVASLQAAMAANVDQQPAQLLPETSPVAAFPLVSTCEQQGEWKDLPANDTSAMASLGKRICTDQDYSATLADPDGARAKVFKQLEMAYDYVNQMAQLGRPLESAELGSIPGKNLPNMYVSRKPNASDDGSIVYTFDLTVRRKADEAGLPLPDDKQVNGQRVGTMTGLIATMPLARTTASSLGAGLGR